MGVLMKIVQSCQKLPNRRSQYFFGKDLTVSPHFQVIKAHPKGLMNKTEMSAMRPSNLKRIKQCSKASTTDMVRVDLVEMVINWKLPMYL